MTPAEALDAAWGTLACLGLIGLGWHIWLAVIVARLLAHGERVGWDADVLHALRVRQRDNAYRIALKAVLTAYAGMRWEILYGATPAVLDWRQTADLGLLAAALALLTVWSIHARVAVYQRRTEPRAVQEVQ